MEKEMSGCSTHLFYCSTHLYEGPRQAREEATLGIPAEPAPDCRAVRHTKLVLTQPSALWVVCSAVTDKQSPSSFFILLICRNLFYLGNISPLSITYSVNISLSWHFKHFNLLYGKGYVVKSVNLPDVVYRNFKAIYYLS